jgi:sugar/nucleoside kinase (ribokinase family)
MPDSTTPDFLSIGVLTYDVTPEPGNPHGRIRPGGAAAFSAVCAQALGLKAAVIASAAADYPVEEILPGIDVHIVESDFTTFFQNVYGQDSMRSQVLGARSSSITRSDIPEAWLETPIVFFGPLVREIPPNAQSWFPHASVGAAVQGWLRIWDDYGRVSEASGPPAYIGSGYRLLAGSISEFHERDAQEMARWGNSTEVLGVTDGAHGSRIYVDGVSSVIPVSDANELDPTGAGDIWAASCLIRLVETGDPVEAARFANAAASISVEQEGLAGAPLRSEVEARLARG